MVLVDVYKIPVGISLAVIASILGVAIAASLWRARRATPPTPVLK
jgi:tellurite resistance protein TerC